MKPSRFPTLLVMAALLMSAWLVCGCNAIGAIAYKAAGPPPVYAKYKPLPRPTLVFADANEAGTASFADADALARFVEQQLTDRRVCPLVPSQKALDLRGGNPNFGKWSVAEIGRKVGAEQVIYLDVAETRVSQVIGSRTQRAFASAKVRVIDASTGALLWPMESQQGYPVQFETPMTSLDDRLTPVEVRNAGLFGLADKIGKLFYDWKPGEDSDTRPEDE
jgi:hypothetical protein